ncbi:MAG: hypothetical protein SFV54_26940 [Bryobacteraceae bacterium]|nr:hypothetical protein [Bryobacteraceae bacterium]
MLRFMRWGAGVVLLVAAEVCAAVPPAAQSSRCGGCHVQSARASHSNMARTLMRPSESPIWQGRDELKSSNAGYDYVIRKAKDELLYEVSNGVETLRYPLRWAVGTGRTGQTYVYEIEGKLHESRISFYPRVAQGGGLDATIGAPNRAPANLAEAAGRRMGDGGVKECFGCHGSGKISGHELTGLTPGVSCERCHGDGSRHVAGFAAKGSRPGRIESFKSATSEEINELCGQCHRTWAQVTTMGLRGVQTVRFQPYRITKSKCYDAEDRRASCVACHDPHTPGEVSASKTERACRSCHEQGRGRKPCGKGADCASCHMPKYELPGAHADFTDHWIRTVRPGEGYRE